MLDNFHPDEEAQSDSDVRSTDALLRIVWTKNVRNEEVLKKMRNRQTHIH